MNFVTFHRTVRLTVDPLRARFEIEAPCEAML